MARLTTGELLRRLTSACNVSDLVESYTVDASDEKTLGVRVFLTNATWLNVFYNVSTGKVAFAWFRDRRRLYGKDNAKQTWHVHPFEAPATHKPCEAVEFETFLREVEDLYPQAYESN